MLAQSVTAGTSDPTVRVFGWQPPAVSFGYAQRVSRDIDTESCREAGIDIVRRPTGGRAVLHWNELTYSVVCNDNDPVVGATIQDAYRVISKCLVAGIRSLGIDARFEPGRRPSPSPVGKDVAAPCFSSTSPIRSHPRGQKARRQRTAQVWGSDSAARIPPDRPRTQTHCRPAPQGPRSFASGLLDSARLAHHLPG